MKASAQITTVTPPCDIRNKWGEFKLRIFRIQCNERLEDIAALYMNLPSEECLLRINSACITSEAFGDLSCDCKWQMDEAIATIRSPNASWNGKRLGVAIGRTRSKPDISRPGFGQPHKTEARGFPPCG